MPEMIHQIQALDLTSRCLHGTFRKVLLIYLDDWPESDFKSKILELNEEIHRFRKAARRTVKVAAISQ